MSSRGKQTAVYEEGIECTPDTLFKGLAGCFGFLLSLVVVTSLGVIAAGVFWTAQNMDRITDSGDYIILRTDILGHAHRCRFPLVYGYCVCMGEHVVCNCLSQLSPVPRAKNA